MDWRAIRFDWNHARAFLVTAEEGSLSAAAKALGMTQPTLGRQVAALEEELGVVLFERVGRGLSPTPSGIELLEHVRAMGEAAGHTALAASGQSQSLEGEICISATEVFAHDILPPIIARLRVDQPGIRIKLIASNSLSDLRRREADIAIRNAIPRDPDLIARKIRDETAELYATTRYLEQIGRPQSSAELAAGASFIGFDDNEALIAGLNAVGLPVTEASFAITCSSHLVHWQMVRRDLGIGVQGVRVAAREPGVEKAAPWLEPFEFPVWLVAHRELNTSRRVRLVFDHLAAGLAEL